MKVEPRKEKKSNLEEQMIHDISDTGSKQWWLLYLWGSTLKSP